MEPNNNPNITPEGYFKLTYFPDTEPHTPLEEVIQFIYDCKEYEEEYQPWTRKTKTELLNGINNVLLPACEEGNQDAIYWIYYAYFWIPDLGMGTEKALEYLTILANYGYPDLQYELGYHCFDIDFPEMGWRSRQCKAAYWLKKAADQGWVDAMYLLGTIYNYFHWGVRHYRKRAFVWLKRAAELGHEEAMGDLSLYYKVGVGTKKDLAKAAEWAEKAGWHQQAERLRNGEFDYDENGLKFYPLSEFEPGSPF